MEDKYILDKYFAKLFKERDYSKFKDFQCSGNCCGQPCFSCPENENNQDYKDDEEQFRSS